jgi:tetratricopeptide (TPR) repeat protein
MIIRHCMPAAGFLCVILLPSLAARGQAVNASTGSITIPTYRLGPADPNPPFPLVNPHPVYPYTMLDDLSDQKGDEVYRAIYLENKYLKISILPQLGGHVYSVYDKIDHREMLYRNNVIKYGLVGPRGAWISGGMEFSFPFAHTTDTVSPVESTLRHNPDGSATALVGAVDWVSNMFWQIAITLRPESARLEEGVTLFNSTPLKHLYLFWTNTAVRATEDTQYIYPMRETISDDPFAIVQSWPSWKGVDQSWYKNNPSAIAIFARDVHRSFFGVYYHQSNYGVVHVADFRQDPGKKLWSWGTAPSGTIWDHILSDNDGPYNEIQSGRFYTQGYREFMSPRTVEKWTEYWYPVRGLDGGFVEATSDMAVNVSYPKDHEANPEIRLELSTVANVTDATIQLKRGTHLLQEFRHINLLPLQTVSYIVTVRQLADAQKNLNIEVLSSQGKTLLKWSAAEPIDGNPNLVPSAGAPLKEPFSITPQTSIEELYLQGVFLQKREDLEGALRIYDDVLKRDPGYVPALIQEALYHYQSADFKQAVHLIAFALQRNDEDPAVEYAAGVIYRADEQLSLAEDAFWKSIRYGDSLVPGSSKSATYVELGEIAMLQRDYAKAVTLFQHALTYNAGDAFARSDLAVAERMSGDPERAAKDSEEALQEMPLLPYALAEHWQDQSDLDTGAGSSSTRQGTATSEAWSSDIANDPENYIAVAAWYHSIGAWKASDAVLHVALEKFPAQSISATACYYLASNARYEGNLPQSQQYAEKAASLPITETFPNRLTDVAVLTEEVQHNPTDAHAKYALGNFLFAHERYDDAAGLWTAALNEGFDSPVLLRNLGVYAWRVKKDLPGAAQDYSRAIQLSPNDYRLYIDLDKIYEEQGATAARISLFRAAPAQVLRKDTVLAREILLEIETSKPDEALALLANHTFKPWEGGKVAHDMLVVANIEKGKQGLANHQAVEAEQAFRRAMQYPENLGTGEPFQPDLTEQWYWVGQALQAQGKTAEADAAWQKAAEQPGNKSDTCAVFSALAYRSLGNDTQAQRILARCIDATAQPDSDASTLYAAGMAEQYGGNAALAGKDFRRALQVDPDLWQARVALNNMGGL